MKRTARQGYVQLNQTETSPTEEEPPNSKPSTSHHERKTSHFRNKSGEPFQYDLPLTQPEELTRASFDTTRTRELLLAQKPSEETLLPDKSDLPQPNTTDEPKDHRKSSPTTNTTQLDKKTKMMDSLPPSPTAPPKKGREVTFSDYDIDLEGSKNKTSYLNRASESFNKIMRGRPVAKKSASKKKEELEELDKPDSNRQNVMRARKPLRLDTTSTLLQSSKTADTAKSSGVDNTSNLPNFQTIIIDQPESQDGNNEDSSKREILVPTSDYLTNQHQILIDVNTDSMDSSFSLITEDAMRNAYQSCHKALLDLKLPRTFWNPEQELINRYCLEYTAMCVKTMPTGLNLFGTKSHFERVFNSIKERTEALGSPISDERMTPDVPILLTRFFTGQFRVRNNTTTNDPALTILLSHSGHLTLAKFTAITTLIFNRKEWYYSKVDISRHRLGDLA
jgi:hypothetical protein